MNVEFGSDVGEERRPPTSDRPSATALRASCARPQRPRRRCASSVGEIVEIYEDRGTGQPSWLAVKTGLFGSNVSFVPLQQATRGDDGIRVAYDKDLVKDAPNSPPTARSRPRRSAASTSTTRWTSATSTTTATTTPALSVTTRQARRPTRR